MSHPAWVCGLKLFLLRRPFIIISHTLRGCVDWNFEKGCDFVEDEVTPCVGVWIETLILITLDQPPIVTPCVGVWIETLFRHARGCSCCHTLRGCVDWNYEDFVIPSLSDVTPCVGVWIETFYSRKSNNVLYSHTLRGCVDWNLIGRPGIQHGDVTPCVGVWIETQYYCIRVKGDSVTPCVGVWIETL